MIYIIFIAFALLSWIIQSTLKSKFKKYSKIPVNGNLSGREVAIKMLNENGINDVTVRSTSGRLSDFYDPASKTVNLSESVYNSRSIAAAAVAAHECGHAIQHANAYALLTLRSKLVPVVNFASSWMTWVLLAGIFTVQRFPQIMLFGIILFAFTTIFSIITLPVEINASARAVDWLNDTGITNSETHPMAVDALKWAAYTYVIAALGSLATLFYYILIFTGASRDN